MSYINDALRKAQKERDGLYEKFSGIITPGPDEPARSRKGRLVVVMAVALFFMIPAGLLLALYIRYQPSSLDKGSQPPAVLENPAALTVAPPGEVSEAGQGKEAQTEQRYNEALSAQRKNDRKQAEILYRRVLALDPGHARALNNLGILCMEEKRTEQAIALFGKAIVLKRDYVDPYYNLACLYARKNEMDESLWYLKVAMTINDEVKNWVMEDADLKSIAASPAFKKIMEGQKN